MYFGLSIFQQRLHNHFAYILCQIKSNLPRHSWHSTDFSWLRLPANAVGWRAGKSLMKILSRTRHLPIAENCAQIISILKRNHWNLSISAGTPTTADAGRHDDAVTDIRPDGGRRCEMWKSNIYDTFEHNFWPSAKVNYKFSSGIASRSLCPSSIFCCYHSLYPRSLPSDLCACLLENSI